MSKMVQTGAYVGPIVVIEKILRQRPDVLGLLLDRCWFEKGIEILIDAVEEASETKYKAMVELIGEQVRRRPRKGGKQETKISRRGLVAREGSWRGEEMATEMRLIRVLQHCP